jgi:putative membrane protein insertion efficiency factor
MNPMNPMNPMTLGAVRLLELYKRRLSPFLPPSCRFTPTCSEYARLALIRHGLGRGSALALLRLLRCQPLHPGGVDLP